MFRKWVGGTNRFLAVFIVTVTLFLSGCLPEKSDSIDPKAFFEKLDKAGIHPQNLDPESSLALTNAIKGYYPLGLYAIEEIELALFDLPLDYNVSFELNYISNKNLYLLSEQPIPSEVGQALNSLSPSLGYEQLGIFVYPLGACFLISIFITLERLFSLRRGQTFPRKVEKALLSGEFPNKKWKQGSAAERIVHVAVHEKASEETLRAYAKLEVSAMERGMFLLEVVVAGAPLIGLLGTVTGLVEVFSQMPAGGTVDKSLFSQGISLALLTTMIGLAIALPTLLFNSYLQRVVDKRASALEWLTARLMEATDRKGPPPEIIR
jgi:biopolymer transport protein ExbB